MKKFLFIIMSIFILVSCRNKEQNQNEIVKNKLEVKFLESMHDPKSYEFISLEIIDTVTFKENIDKLKEEFSERIEQEKFQIANEIVLDDNDRNILKSSILNLETEMIKLDSINSALGLKNKEASSYTYKYSFRANNAFGAKVKSDYYVQVSNDSTLEIFNITEDVTKMIKTKNEFPGFLQVYKLVYPESPLLK